MALRDGEFFRIVKENKVELFFKQICMLHGILMLHALICKIKKSKD